ncbi:MAG TPA: hypothetical protein VIU93_08970 [Gallionellaceae bacterium]
MSKLATWMLAAFILMVADAGELRAEPELDASQIVEKNVAARGGLEAWRKIQTMVWVGHIESENAPGPSLPFVLELKRPDKTRFEIKAQNQMSIRIFDGTHGWKLRPARNGQPEVQPYTAEELSFAQNGNGIDGPLMDFHAKGIAVTLDGIDEIEGHKAYRLSVKLPSGVSHHVWIDAQTFLEVKYDRESRNAFGMTGTVSVFYRNYQAIEGLQIPLLLETGAGAAKAMDKMVIDRIVLNPALDDRTFAKPAAPWHRNAASVDLASPRVLRSIPAWSGGAQQSGSGHVAGSFSTQTSGTQ